MRRRRTGNRKQFSDFHPATPNDGTSIFNYTIPRAMCWSLLSYSCHRLERAALMQLALIVLSPAKRLQTILILPRSPSAIKNHPGQRVVLPQSAAVVLLLINCAHLIILFRLLILNTSLFVVLWHVGTLLGKRKLANNGSPQWAATLVRMCYGLGRSNFAETEELVHIQSIPPSPRPRHKELCRGTFHAGSNDTASQPGWEPLWYEKPIECRIIVQLQLCH